MITNKQKLFFEKLKDTYGNEPLPSFEIIAQDFNFKSKNSVAQYFSKLTEIDLIVKKHNNFFINNNEFGAILYSSKIKAGFPSTAEDHQEKRISLDENFRLNSPSTFMFEVSGDSMIDLGILEGDKVVVKKTGQARSGDVVLACVDNEYTLKTYRNINNKVFLEPANKNYPIITPKETLTLFGVVTGVIREM